MEALGSPANFFEYCFFSFSNLCSLLLVRATDEREPFRLQGARGRPGSDGAMGNVGEKGSQGDPGPIGATGATGEKVSYASLLVVVFEEGIW